jgi:nucleotide-binding universal stress UspA family protein
MFETIVVGTDGSDTAAEAVRRAADIAKSSGAVLHLVSAYKPLEGLKVGGGAGPEGEEWRLAPDMQVETILRDTLDGLSDSGVSVSEHALKGEPADAILAVAESERADLVVVGNKGMTGARRFLLGSVPSKVAHHAPCTVMIVRTT